MKSEIETTDEPLDFLELDIEELEDRAQPMMNQKPNCGCSSSCDCTSCSCIITY